MRQIKFRVWDLNQKLWWSCWHIDEQGKSVTGHDGESEYLSTVVIQQYTGVQDDNKKDIHEGDIVRVSERTSISTICDPSLKDYTHGQIKWLNCGWKVCQKNLGSTPLSDFLDCECHPSPLIIIGNIFENPELC